MNDEGIHFPIWAICLGFEQIAIIEHPVKNLLDSLDAHDIAQNVNFTHSSHIYENFPKDLMMKMMTDKIVYDNHIFGLTVDTFESSTVLMDAFKIVATAVDRKNVQFVETIEHKDYPIFAHQYHPEKNVFIWSPEVDVPHSADAIKVTQLYADFLIKESKKNTNQFPTWEDEFSLWMEQFELRVNSGVTQENYIIPG